jgi:nucleoid DNA-binding protein
MTKKEVVDAVLESVEHKHTIGRKHVMVIVECVFDSFIDLLEESGRIEIRDFGVFKVKRSPARVGRNPLTGVEADVPTRNIIQFKAGKKMSDDVEHS